MNTITKFLGWTAFILVILFIFGVRFPFLRSESEGTVRVFNSDKRKLKELMKSEPKVKDFTLTNAKVLYISVLSDGTKRDGLASYFCDLMKDENIVVYRVKIIQYASMNATDRDNAYGIMLGDWPCK